MSKTYSKPILWFFGLMWTLVLIAAHAGGLGIAPIAAITGGLGLLVMVKMRGARWLGATPGAIWCIIALLTLGVVSSVWSPYQTDDNLSNPLKLLIGVPLFMLAAVWVGAQPATLKTKFAKFVIGLSAVWSLVLCADIISGYQISWLIDPPAIGSDFNIKRGDSLQNLSHAVSFAAVLAPLMLALGWARGALCRLAAAGYLIMVLVAGYSIDANANVFAAIAASTVFALGLWRAKLILCLGMIVSAMTVLLAPVIAFFAHQASPEFKNGLPFSWAERVENWSYMYVKIIEKPVFGHGFDAVRTFNDTHTIRGFEGRAIVSLHPHNAGLHIWAELGAVGVLLVMAAFVFGWMRLKTANLRNSQIAAIAGLITSASIISALSYGVWQDWWWASVIMCSALVCLISPQENAKI